MLLACALGLDAADKGTVGAVAAELEQHLHITPIQVGLLVTLSSATAAIATVPVGWLTDRINRVHLLAVTIVLWCVAMVLAGAAGSYGVLLLARIALGAVAATAGPTLASLTGDLFPAAERAKIWGMILSGELLGAGIGFLISGDLAGILSWRWAFWWLAAPGLVLAVALTKLLPEPARGGQSRLQPGAEEVVGAQEIEENGEDLDEQPDDASAGLARKAVRRKGVEPDPELVLHHDPERMPLWEAVKYVLRVRTNLILIVASALGYFFFAGVQTFTVVLLRSHYGLGQSAASSLAAVIGLGALVGVVLSGRIADRRLRRGRLNARIVVGAAGPLIAAVLLVPALLSDVLVISLPLFVVAAAGLAASNPPLNAARLDIMHPRLWGRAEGVRTLLQMAAVAAAPLLFGVLSEEFGGPSQAVSGSEHVSGGHGVALAFLVMLVPMVAGALLVLRARRTYPRDVATAAASAEAAVGEESPSEEMGHKFPHRGSAITPITGSSEG